jgi:hypothetical protein
VYESPWPQKQVNEAAEKFAGAIEDFYQASPSRFVSTQKLYARLIQDFFSDVINCLRIQALNDRTRAGCDL